MTAAGTVPSVLAETAAAERTRIVAALIRFTGDWDLAEDCVQDAAAKALAVWPERGVPDNPGAWLTTAARNRAVDILRRRATEKAAMGTLAAETELAMYGAGTRDVNHGSPLTDDRLRLIFTCCHPALSMEARVALTLRTVAGLGTAEIARAFLISEPTMEKRLVRARSKIRNAGIPYQVPPEQQLPDRVDGVLAVLYLLFNEGYSSIHGTGTVGTGTVPAGLQREAIRLADLLVSLLGGSPYSAETLGLLALMQFTSARNAARTNVHGELVTLEEQDRSLWDWTAIDAGRLHLAAAEQLLHRDGAYAGRYQLQARIAACHAAAGTPAETNFDRIVRLYDELAQVSPSPVIELNRAAAVAMAVGAQAGLALVEALAGSAALDGYYLLYAVRADLLRRLGRHQEAAADYRRAAGLAPSEAERRYLDRRASESAIPQ